MRERKAQHHADRLIDKNTLVTIVPLSLSHIDRLEKKGQFPSRRRLGPRRVAWVESEVRHWIENRPRGFGGAA